MEAGGAHKLPAERPLHDGQGLRLFLAGGAQVMPCAQLYGVRKIPVQVLVCTVSICSSWTTSAATISRKTKLLAVTRVSQIRSQEVKIRSCRDFFRRPEVNRYCSSGEESMRVGNSCSDFVVYWKHLFPLCLAANPSGFIVGSRYSFMPSTIRLARASVFQ